MCLVLGDAVAVERVAGGDHLPGQPAGRHGFVAGEEEGEVSRLAATAADVVRDGLRDGFHLSLMAVGAWVGGGEEFNELSSIRNYNQL